jgi:two-component system sensor histidine kinase RpfC
LGDRLKGRHDTEHVQAIIRILISGVIMLYLNSGIGVRGPLSEWGDRIPVIYTLASAAIFLWIFVRPEVSLFRRYFAMVMDFGLESLCLVLEGERAAPLFLVYIWVSLGNGFRFGVRSMLWSMVVSTFGFCSVIAFSPFFQSILPVSIGMALTLVAIPCYAASLIRKLHDAKTAAEEANQTKSRFLATASHELRTPLHAIIGLSDLLEHTHLTSEQKEMIQTVRSSGGALLSLVEDILDVSSIQAGRMVTEIADFDLYRNLAETIAIATPQATRNKLQLGLYVEPTVPRHLNGDWKHIRQILLNLLTNAIKFTKEGSVVLTVRSLEKAEGACLRFEVKDTGIGIPKEDQSRIFELFAQVNGSGTRSYSGVGLGLSIVRQLTELLNGKIDVKSEMGIGSTFGVELPFRMAMAAPPQTMNSCVLVHSDDPVITRVLHAYFPDIKAVSDYRDLKDDDLPVPVCVIVDRRGQSAEETDTITEQISENLSSRPIAFISLSGDSTEREIPLRFVTSLSLPIDPANLAASLTIGEALATHRVQIVPDIEWKPDAEKQAAKPAEASPQGDLNCSVLVVDDSPVNRMVTYKILHSAGYTVTLAEDGSSALELLADQEFSIVMLDINMPGASGLDIIKLYRVMRLGESVPHLVVFSAEVTEDVRQECIEQGVSLFLPKPSTPSLMLDKLAELVPVPVPVPVAKPDIEPDKVVPDKVTYLDAHPRYVATMELNVIDRSVVQNLLDLDQGPAFLEQLVGEFERDTVTVLDAVDTAVQTGSMLDFWDQVHAMRSSAANVGARQVFAACIDMNAQGRMSFNTRGSEYAARLRYEFTRYQRAIHKLLYSQARLKA